MKKRGVGKGFAVFVAVGLISLLVLSGVLAEKQEADDVRYYWEQPLVSKQVQQAPSEFLPLAKQPASKIDPLVSSASGKDIDVIVSVAYDDPALLFFGRDVKKYGDFYSMSVPRTALSTLESLASVERVWLDKEYKPLLDVSAPFIGATSGWAVGVNGTGIKVCVIDTGVNKSVPALSTRVIAERDFIIGDSDGDNPSDFDGHGSHVAGIVASTDSTFHGVAHGVGILNAKVFNSTSGGAPTSAILSGIDWCIIQGANILSLSLGAKDETNNGGDALSQYVDSAVDQGKIVVVAAGNSGPSGDADCRTSRDASGASFSVCSPGLSHKAITVGSFQTGKSGTLAGIVSNFSSRGPTADGRIKPDLLAPGEIIASTGKATIFENKSGTSMAAPHISGVAALVLQVRPLITPEELKALLMNSVFGYGQFLKNSMNGTGRVNATRVLAEVNFTAAANISTADRAHRFFVASPTDEIRVTLYWPENVSQPNDVDLFLIDPSGITRDSSGNIQVTEELANVSRPNMTGYWKVIVSPFLVAGRQPYAVAVSHPLSGQLAVSAGSLFIRSFHTINASAGSSLNVSLDWGNGTQNIDIFLTNATGTLLGASTRLGNNNENITVSNLNAGQLTLVVEPIDFGGAASVPYSLTSSLPVSFQIVQPTNNITLHAPLNGSNISGAVLLNLSASNKSKSVNWDFRNSTGTKTFTNSTANSMGAAFGNESWRRQLDTTLLNDGAYNVSASVSDQAGRVNSTSSDNATHVLVDNNAPVITFNSPTPTNGSTITGMIGLNVTVNDAVTMISDVTMLLDGQAVRNCSSSDSPGAVNCFYLWDTVALSGLGAHDFNVSVNDSLNNRRINGVAYTVFQSSTNNITLTAPVNGTNMSAVFALQALAGNKSKNVTWTLKNASGFFNFSNATSEGLGSSAGNTTWRFQLDTRTLNEGSYTATLSVINQLGQLNATSDANPAHVIVDNTPPVIGYNSSTPANLSTIAGVKVINVTAEDALTMVSVVSIFIDNNAIKNCSSEDTPGKINCTFAWNAESFGKGSHTFHAVANDSLNNVRALGLFNVTVFHAATNNVTLNAPRNGTNVSGVFLLNVSAGNKSVNVTWSLRNATGLSNFSNATASNNGAAFGNESWRFQLDTMKLNEGDYNVTVTVFNQLGRVNQTSDTNPAHVRVDNTPPTAAYALPTPAGGANVSGNQVINVSAQDAVTLVNGITLFVDNHAVSNCTGGSVGGLECAYSWDTVRATGINSNGTHTLRATVNDSLGNRVNLTTRTITVDNVPPVITYSDAPANQSVVSGLQTISVIAQDAVMPVSNVTVVVDSNAVKNCTGSSSVGPIGCTYIWNTEEAGHASHTFSVSATDALGNAGSTVPRTVSMVDGHGTTNNVTLHNPASDANITALTVLNVSGSNHSIRVTWEFANVTNSFNFSNSSVTTSGQPFGNESWRFQMDTRPLNDGAYSVLAHIVNQTGHVNSTTALRVRVDNTAPLLRYNLSTPGNGDRVTGVQAINVTAEDDTTLISEITIFADGAVAKVCSPDAPGKINCTFSWNVEAAGHGTHNFSATANDSVGNSVSLGTFTITAFDGHGTTNNITLLGPLAGMNVSGVILLNASASNKTRNVTWNFRNITGVSSFMNTTASNDGAPFGNESWRLQFSTLQFNDGMHNVSAVSQNQSGHINETIPVLVAIDNTAPVITFNVPTPANGSSVTGLVGINVTVNDAVTMISDVTMLLDGQAIKNCSSSDSPGAVNCFFLWDTVAVSGLGAHDFNVSVNDSLNNRRVNGVVYAVFQSSTNNLTLTAPVNGTNMSGVFALQALAGNKSKNVTWTLKNASGFFNFSNATSDGLGSSAGNTSWRFQLDTTKLNEGKYNATLSVINQLGQLNATSDASPAHVVVDNTPPVIGYNSSTPANLSTIAGVKVINVTAEDALTLVQGINVMLDGQAVKNCTLDAIGRPDCAFSWDTVGLSGLNSNGTHRFNATATDGANNTRVLGEFTVIVDNVGPVVAYNESTPANASNVTGLRVINVSAEDAAMQVSVMTILIDGNAVKNCTGGAGKTLCTYDWVTEAFGHGSHTFQAVANDSLNNVRALGLFNVTVFGGHGMTNSLSLLAPAAGHNLSRTALLNISGSNHTKNVTWSFINTTNVVNFSNASTDNNGAAFGNESWRFQLNTSGLNDGLYNVTGYVVNQSNVMNSTSTGFEVRVDNAGPVVVYNLSTPANASQVTDGQVINVTAEDALTMVSVVSIFLDNNAVKNCSSEDTPGKINCTFAWNAESFGKGSHTFQAVANDSLNNVRALGLFNVTVFHAATNNITLLAPRNGTNMSGVFLLNASAGNKSVNVTWSFRNSTAVTNFSNATSSNNGAVFGNESWRLQVDTTKLNEGDYNITVTAFNQLGRVNQTSDSNPAHVKVDNTAPLLALNLSTPANGTTVSSLQVINITAEDGLTLVDGITVYVDGNAVKNCTGDVLGKINCTFAWSTEGFGEGMHAFNASALDNAGNSRALAVREVRVVDGHGTTNNVSLLAPLNNTVLSGVVVLNASASNKSINVMWRFENASTSVNFSNATASNNGAAFGNESWRFQLNTSGLNDGEYNVTLYVLNQTFHLNQTSESNTTLVRINNALPGITFLGCVPSVANLTNAVVCNVSITDTGISVVSADMVFPNGSNTNQTITTNGNVRGFVFTNTSVRGIYNVSWVANTTANSVNKIVRNVTVQNRIPTLNASVPAITMVEDTNLTINISAFIQDPEGDALTFTAVGVTSNLSIFVNATIGNVTLQPAPNFTGVHNIVFRVTDALGGANASNNITVTVNGQNDDGPIVEAFPVITFSEDLVNTSINLSTFVFDPDTADDKITWTKAGDANILFSVLPSGNASFSAAKDFCGTSAIVLRANDSNITANAPVTVSVNCVQDAPVVEQLSPVNNTLLQQTSSAVLSWNASDVDGDSLVFRVVVRNNTDDVRNITTSGSSTNVTGLVSNVLHYWRVHAMDSKTNTSNTLTNSSTATRQFTVVDNLPPIISAIVPSNTAPSVAEGSELLFNVTATDPEKASLSRVWVLDNKQVTINESFTYKPGFSDSGVHIVNVTVSDDKLNTVSQKWTVTVTDKNIAPAIVGTIPAQTLVEDSSSTILDLTRFESDTEDGDAGLTWKASGVDARMLNIAVSSATDEASITPVKDASGSDTVTFTLTDSGGLSVSQDVVITVTAVNDIPVINTFAPLTTEFKVGENTTTTFTVVVSDADGTTPRVTWLLDGANVSTTSTFRFISEKLGVSRVTVEVSDGTEKATKEWRIDVRKNPVLDTFDGATTFSVETMNDTELASVRNFTLQRSGEARIEFTQPVDLRDVVDLDTLVATDVNLVGVDAASGGINRPARITLFGVNLNNPVMLFADGLTTNVSKLTQLCKFCRVVNNTAGQLVFEADHFTTFTAVSSTAAELDVPSEVSFGSVERNTSVQTTFVVKNKGNLESLTNVQVSSTAASQYAMQFSVDNSSFSSTLSVGTLSPLEQKTITVKATVPGNENTGEHDFADIVVSSTQSTKTISSVKLNPRSSLSIKKVEVDNDGLNEGGSADVKPGDTVEVEVEVENTLKELDMDDVEIEVTVFDIDDNDDIEETTKEFEIRAGDSKTKKVSIKIPEELDDDTYDIQVRVSSTDENGGSHEASLNGVLDIDKEKHKLTLSAEATPSELSCDRLGSLGITVKNLGANDEDDVDIRAESASLGMHEGVDNVDIDEGDNYHTSFSLNLERVVPGTYSVDVRVLLDGGLEDNAVVPVRVRECTEKKEVAGAGLSEKDIRSRHEQLLSAVLAQQMQAAPVQAEKKEAAMFTPLQLALLLGLGVFDAFVLLIVVMAAAKKRRTGGFTKQEQAAGEQPAVRVQRVRKR